MLAVPTFTGTEPATYWTGTARRENLPSSAVCTSLPKNIKNKKKFSICILPLTLWAMRIW
jgi:hypothetical protein